MIKLVSVFAFSLFSFSLILSHAQTTYAESYYDEDGVLVEEDDDYDTRGGGTSSHQRGQVPNGVDPDILIVNSPEGVRLAREVYEDLTALNNNRTSQKECFVIESFEQGHECYCDARRKNNSFADLVEDALDEFPEWDGQRLGYIDRAGRNGGFQSFSFKGAQQRADKIREYQTVSCR